VARIHGLNQRVTIRDGGESSLVENVVCPVLCVALFSHGPRRFSFNNYRYLWPLIHYHKFLAKCIKKLKRNGVDVKISLSPVAVFLREEVCAVSDHLAAVSLFQSEQWMECLLEFEGWSNATPAAEARLRVLIGNLRLRPLEEPGDVESPLLRDQIDEQFLRSMVAARESMTGEPKTKPPRAPKSVGTENTTQSTRHGLPLHPQSVRL
jgi:hypothetical protein